MKSSGNKSALTEYIRAVIFDLDDTLYPERDFVCSGFRHIAALLEEWHGLTADEAYAELIRDFDNGLRGNNFNILLEKRGLNYSENNISDLVAAYRAHEPDISLPLCSKEILANLRARGILLGLVTDGYLETQMKKVKALELADSLDAIVYTDSWGRSFWKPHRRAFNEISRLLNMSTTACCYVADNPIKDFKGANDCGMLSIQVLHWADRSGDLVPEEYRPDIIYRKLEDLLENLGRRN